MSSNGTRGHFAAQMEDTPQRLEELSSDQLSQFNRDQMEKIEGDKEELEVLARQEEELMALAETLKDEYVNRVAERKRQSDEGARPGDNDQNRL